MIDTGLLTDPEKRRFSKQMLLPHFGKEGQEKIKNTKIVVIGVGGVGTAVLQYLAATGIGHLGIIDFTLVDETNIQQQTLYGGNDLGKLKSIISRQNLQNLFPFVNFEIINLQLTPHNISRILNPFGLIVDATNNTHSHRLISEACVELQRPYIYGSIQDFLGEVAVVRVENLDKFAAFLSKKVKNENEEAEKGASAIAYGFLGNLMALESVKFILQHPDVLQGEIVHFDILSYNFSVESFVSHSSFR